MFIIWMHLLENIYEIFENISVDVSEILRLIQCIRLCVKNVIIL